MHSSIISVFFLLSAFISCYSFPPANPNYRIADIPKEILPNAGAVIRKSETEFEIKDKSTAVMKITYAISILNTASIDKSVFTGFYDKFLAVRNITWKLYDEYGNQVKNNSNVTIEDYSAIAGFSLYEDSRVKVINPRYRTIPFTVEYSYEIAYKGLVSYPKWRVFDDYNIAVEKSVFRVIAPDNSGFRFMESNLPVQCLKTSGGGKSVWTWSVSNQKAITKEPFSPSIEEYTPVVYTAPSDFEISGFSGNAETWSGFSKWIDLLDEGRDVLGSETTEKIRFLIADAKSDYEKISILYKYMQDKVRYVSTQIGIGGMRTEKAETVDRLSYGDCKALSNYMKSLLGIAGIRSYYTLVSAGEEQAPLKADFSSNQFNHAIVCVPLRGDTLWLECTDQHIPAGYIGTFTDDRKVLLTGEGAGCLAKTKAYGIDENTRSRKIILDIKPDGNAESVIETSYNGIFFNEALRIMMMDQADRKILLQKSLRIPSFTITGMRHEEKRAHLPSINEELRLSVQNYASTAGERMLVNPNLMTRFSDVPPRVTTRKSPVRIRRPYCETDTAIVKIPEQYRPDQLQPAIEISSIFGDYTALSKVYGNEIRYIRKLRLFKGDFPVEYYPEFVDFCEKVAVADNTSIVLMATGDPRVKAIK